jgi:hypothetical protein
VELSVNLRRAKERMRNAMMQRIREVFIALECSRAPFLKLKNTSYQKALIN